MIYLWQINGGSMGYEWDIPSGSNMASQKIHHSWVFGKMMTVNGGFSRKSNIQWMSKKPWYHGNLWTKHLCHFLLWFRSQNQGMDCQTSHVPYESSISPPVPGWTRSRRHREGPAKIWISYWMLSLWGSIYGTAPQMDGSIEKLKQRGRIHLDVKI